MHLGDGVKKSSRRSLKSKEAVRQIFTLKIILVYVQCSQKFIWNGHNLWTVGGAQCAQFVVSIHFDLSRHFKVCLTDRLASLNVCVLISFFVLEDKDWVLYVLRHVLGLEMMLNTLFRSHPPFGK